MAVQFSSTQRAAAIGVASAGLLIGAFTHGAGQGSAAPAPASGVTGNAALTAAAALAAPAGTRITVTGTGNVSGAPNELALSMGVQTNGTSVAAALIWLPATDRRRSVIVSCSLTWYPLGTPELLA